MPADIMAQVFPELYMVRAGHTDIRFDLYIDSMPGVVSLE